MSIILFGANGMLGRSITALAEEKCVRVSGISHEDADITCEENVKRAVSRINPLLVVNAAAYTRVDEAEDDPDGAYAVNSKGPEILAAVCRSSGIPLIHVSTDFVFDGKKNTPYVESDPVNPLGIYGKSKAAGETAIRNRLDAHIIIRTSWLYGVYGKNFVKTMIRLGMEKKQLSVVSDQFGCPTSAQDLAETILVIAGKIPARQNQIWGTYHYCGNGIVSWHEFAREIINTALLYCRFVPPAVEPVTTRQYPVRAQRPQYSALNCDKINEVFNIRTKPWKESLAPVIRTITTHPELHLFP